MYFSPLLVFLLLLRFLLLLFAGRGGGGAGEGGGGMINDYDVSEQSITVKEVALSSLHVAMRKNN